MKSNEAISNEQIRERVGAIVAGLPQRAVIADEDAKAWIDETVAVHGELAIWHAIRLGGFGGSEIGVLVRNAQGERADFNDSARDICRRKLMLEAPVESAAQMIRGHENEAIHAQKFYAKYGVQRAQEEFSKIANGVGPRPWMRYSPDEVFFVPKGGMAERMGMAPGLWLGDYKAPTVVDESESIKFQYACQLHQGAMVAHHNGVKLSGLMLSQYDWAQWALKDDVIQYDPALARRIVEAGDSYWGMVLKGSLPPYIRRKRLEISDESRKQLSEAASGVATHLAIGKAAIERAALLKDEIKSSLESMRFAGGKLDLGALVISAVSSVDVDRARAALGEDLFASLPPANKTSKWIYDVDALVNAAKAAGVDVRLLRRRPPLESALYDALGEAGFDPDSFMTESIRMELSKEVVAHARDWANRSLPALKPLRPAAANASEAGPAANDDQVVATGQDSDTANGHTDDRVGSVSTERFTPRAAA